MNDINYPLRHLSIRVPWHDNGWNGTICKEPTLNGACLVLPRIAELKDEALENKLTCKSIDELKSSEFPCCIVERSSFMAPFEFNNEMNHPYVKTSPHTHGHFAPTPLRFPPYSTATLPFYWMANKEGAEKVEEYKLDFDKSLEPELGFHSNWIQHRDNQKVLLDCFFGHIKPEESLCFFYAKRVPFYEGSERIIIGVGKIKKINEGVEYKYKAEGALKSMLWERLVEHSIRPDFKDGFLLPYYEAIEHNKKNPEFDPAEIIVKAPNDRKIEFSYASEHVTNDSAIRVLHECKKSLERAIELEFKGNYKQCIQWIDERLNEINKLRGYYPGLGAVLNAFGLETGYFIASSIIEKIKEDGNPWELINETFNVPNKLLPQKLSAQFTTTICRTWNSLSKERKDLLYLLSRFEISSEQAKMLFVEAERKNNGLTCSNSDILQNPYIISEITAKTESPVSIWTIDLGMFPKEKIITDLLPLDYNFNDKFDSRRIRGFCIYLLENAATNQGHSLLPLNQIINQLRALPARPALDVNEDILNVISEDFSEVIKTVNMKDASKAFQLNRLVQIKEIIKSTIKNKISSKRHEINLDFRHFLIKELEKLNIRNEEKNSLDEQESALKELAASRISVLIGPAGTGKTTLLSLLCKIDDVKKNNILLLAPTGKARVKMMQVTKELKLDAFTVAQFLAKFDRYDQKSQTYHLSEKQGCVSYGTVIIDESSMLTEEMLGALFDCIGNVPRIILVGDPKQLPPIGSGRPFVDVVSFLKPDNIDFLFPKTGTGYAELTIKRRQKINESSCRKIRFKVGKLV